MLPRYILAFICSAALMVFWVSLQPKPAEKDAQKEEANLAGGNKKPAAKDPAQPELKPGKPGEAPSEKPQKPGELTEPAEPDQPASTAAGIEVKEGRLLKDGKELAGSAGAAGLSIEGAAGFEPVNFQGEDKAPEKNVWQDEGKAGAYTITRVITDDDAVADDIQQLSVELTFKGAGGEPLEKPLRYRIHGPSFSAEGDRVIAASRVKGEVRSWAFDPAQPGGRTEGEAEWVALRKSDRLAVLSVEEKAEAAVADAKGIALEGGLADGDSEVTFDLSFGSSAPGQMINYADNGIGGELFRINRTWEDFVPDRFRVAVDSERGLAVFSWRWVPFRESLRMTWLMAGAAPGARRLFRAGISPGRLSLRSWSGSRAAKFLSVRKFLLLATEISPGCLVKHRLMQTAACSTSRLN